VQPVAPCAGWVCCHCGGRLLAPGARRKFEGIKTMSNENVVDHPTHYNAGKVEVIEAIEDWRLNFHRGNAVKYIARAGKKNPDKEIEDLKKSIWYLRREIERLTAEQEGRALIKPNDMNKSE
jgi:hypothetical protein